MNYLSEKEAAKVLHVSIYTLQQWRYKKVGPKYYILPKRRVRYLELDILQWQEDNKISIRG
ncbi:MAG: hypothetical protein A3K77_00780 [Euryarchaeota archaeon RBG_13_31_8]|nr:MAG: hypothetical protein A3K77_00780 [Euryarchaeota archaeon RBG_13_31_8]